MSALLEMKLSTDATVNKTCLWVCLRSEDDVVVGLSVAGVVPVNRSSR